MDLSAGFQRYLASKYMEQIDAVLWFFAIIPALFGGIGFWLLRRSRHLAIVLVSGAAGFAVLDIALLVFFSGFMV